MNDLLSLWPHEREPRPVVPAMPGVQGSDATSFSRLSLAWAMLTVWKEEFTSDSETLRSVLCVLQGTEASAPDARSGSAYDRYRASIEPLIKMYGPRPKPTSTEKNWPAVDSGPTFFGMRVHVSEHVPAGGGVELREGSLTVGSAIRDSLLAVEAR